jgi:hypothetical protein
VLLLAGRPDRGICKVGSGGCVTIVPVEIQSKWMIPRTHQLFDYEQPAGPEKSALHSVVEQDIGYRVADGGCGFYMVDTRTVTGVACCAFMPLLEAITWVMYL